MFRLFLGCVTAIALTAPATAQVLGGPATVDEYWGIGREQLKERLKDVKPARARNVILLVGDGMGISTITAARIFEKQQKTKAAGFAEFGEENSLSFERFPHLAMVKTYNTNAQVPDSAGTASAFNTGIKTKIGMIGMRQDQTPETCATPAEFPRNMAEIAKGQGMAVGVVTTTRITHATPAAVYAHVPSRNWEARDRSWPEMQRSNACTDIASQLVAFAPGGGLDVVLGGGRARFVPIDAGGTRDDGRDLRDEWKKRFPAGSYVEEAGTFRALSASGKGPVLGLFNDDHISYRADRDPAVEPSLPEMASFAVRRLQATGKPFYLMVEAGRIDHAHHATNPYRALDETVELSDTVAALQKLVGPDTLILVTADHSHVFTIAGYPERGNDILGYIKPVGGGESRTGLTPEGFALDDRGVPMTTLGYQNGPFEGRIGQTVLSRQLPPTDKNYLANKLHGLDSETHGGEDVALFAVGPGSALVSGVIEQNTIFHIMAQALGWK
ncbi:alkaline phosphatase [Sandaracinobacteroides saxicola]|uniref:Alkaline phosphatase n=1 Tax=Sandaracinobacteroides saxicola TaxID=2759707 RepID=A0A7G5IG58_9SPHN|nr:alkaline phosphatase [Sandaracinobacteroides saxicola]QMW22350.1 alkaline phosphatase [Sandaracinobacteroides saxicola]